MATVAQSGNSYLARPQPGGLGDVIDTILDKGLVIDAYVRVSVVGRNLGDSRPLIAESEIGDAQNYVAAPRRFFAELGVRF